MLANRMMIAASGGTRAWDNTYAGDNDIYGLSIRNICKPLLARGSQVRATFKSGTTSDFVVQNCAIGISNGTYANTVATPVELLFAGGHGFTISTPGVLKVSDWAALSVGKGQALVVIVDCYTTTVNHGHAASAIVGGSNGRRYFISGATYNVAAPGAGTGSDGKNEAVILIETRG